MISLDTETTGLYFSHGCQTFAIGIYNGEDVGSIVKPINPLTRYRHTDFTQDEKELIREAFDDDLICMHNSGFDIKALVEAGVFSPKEPDQPEFWDRILDTTILSHLHHNTDDRSLKTLTPQYLDRDYLSDDVLNEVINKCRMFIRSRRPKWLLAGPKVPQLKPSGSNPKWWKSDMWLPQAIVSVFDRKELEEYGFDYETLSSCLNTYLADDCINTYNLAQTMLKSVIDDYGSDVPELLRTNNQILHVIYKMERHGTPVHKKELDSAISVCEYWIKKLTEDTERMSGIKGITDTKLRTILFDTYALPYTKETKTGQPSVDAETIISLKRQVSQDPELSEANEFLTKIMALKKYTKKHGYLTAYHNCMINDKVYPSYFIVGTDTLRMSAKNPATQTVSKATNPFEDEFDDITELLEQSPPLRSIFGPAKDRWWLCNDYSQLQLRIFAVATNEQGMIDAFARGWDAHDYTARRIFNLKDDETPSKGQRRIAKNVNFGFIFGASPKKIERTAGMVGLWDTVCEMFPNAHDFIEAQKDILKLGQPVRTLGGYPLDVPMKEVKWKGTHEKAAHAAVCYIVQGTEGEIVKRAMRNCDDYLTQYYPEGRLVMQVHDEISFDMPAKFPKKHARALKNIMEESAMEFNVLAPVNCEITTHRWDQCKEFNLGV